MKLISLKSVFLKNFYKTWKVDEDIIKGVHPPPSLKNSNISKDKHIDLYVFADVATIYSTATIVQTK